MAVYLKAVPAVHDPADERPVYSWGAAASDLARLRGVAWPGDRDQLTGPQLYDAYCATCHQAHGEGSFEGALPALFHNTALGRANSANLVMVILQGLHRQPDVYMPPFGHQLSDRQIATLASYLTRRWGNPKATVSTEQVRTLRGGGLQSTGLLTLARVGIGVAIILLALLVLLLARRQRRRRLHGGLGPPRDRS
jgi:mono/diheme cytochrome c family protein